MRGSKLLIASIVLIAIGLVGATVVVIMWGFGSGSGLGQITAFKSNGQRIYYTATDESGTQIAFTGGPMWLQMHGGSCVSCHGPGARGGNIVPMTNLVAPDIRYKTLTSTAEGMLGEEHPPYTDATIRRAVTQGLDQAGHRLSPVMPRWDMSEKDLNDLVSYLKTLDHQNFFVCSSVNE